VIEFELHGLTPASLLQCVGRRENNIPRRAEANAKMHYKEHKWVRTVMRLA
jgi:hypothetical protein